MTDYNTDKRCLTDTPTSPCIYQLTTKGEACQKQNWLGGKLQSMSIHGRHPVSREYVTKKMWDFVAMSKRKPVKRCQICIARSCRYFCLLNYGQQFLTSWEVVGEPTYLAHNQTSHRNGISGYHLNFSH